MAEKILKGINFPGLEDTYIIPEVDDTLSKPGASADAKVVGEALAGKQPIGNYIKTINGNAPDENGNIEVVGGGGGEGVAIQSDWNVTDETSAAYIKNKPFGETVEIIERIDWDGNTEGLTSVAGVFYKVSDSIFTDEQIKTCTILASNGFSLVASQIWDDAVSMGVVTEDSAMLEVAIFIRRPTAFSDMAFNEPGVYFAKEGDIYVTSVTFSEPVEINTVKKLDNKYLEIIDFNSANTFLQEQTLTFAYEGQLKENLHDYFYGYYDFNGNNTGNTDISFFNLLNDNIEVGNEYTITFDGVPYKCIAHDVAKDIEPTATVNKCIAIGNYSETLNNGEPFTIILWDIAGSDTIKFGYISVKNTEKLDSVQHTISISKAGKVQIKPEYLPDNIGGGSSGPSLPEVTTEDAGKFLRVTDEGIWAAISIPNAEGARF